MEFGKKKSKKPIKKTTELPSKSVESPTPAVTPKLESPVESETPLVLETPEEFVPPPPPVLVPKLRIQDKDGAVGFYLGEQEILRFCPNGKAYVRGELIENNQTLYGHVREFFSKAHT